MKVIRVVRVLFVKDWKQYKAGDMTDLRVFVASRLIRQKIVIPAEHLRKGNNAGND
jgi:hypothetical protein